MNFGEVAALDSKSVLHNSERPGLSPDALLQYFTASYFFDTGLKLYRSDSLIQPLLIFSSPYSARTQPGI